MIEATELNTRVARGIHRLRTKKKLTIIGLAEIAGVTPSTIGRIEADKNGVRGLMMLGAYRIAEALDVTLDELLEAGDDDD